MNINTTSLPVLQDQFGRQKKKLRISITDRCNFKCIYCMPEHPQWMNKKDLLSFDDLLIFCQFMISQGIESIRITGGEPLLRQGIIDFIEDLQSLRALGLKRISLTTNGYYLAQYAAALKLAGLDDLNISLDSLDPSQFRQLTGKEIDAVFEGIDAVKAAGLPFKLNCVLIRGQNDQQILPMVNWAKSEQIVLRFIEFMPLDGDQHWTHQAVISEAEIIAQLETHYTVSTIAQQHEPARHFLLDGVYQIGVISTITHSFCTACDRIRLTAQGELYNCLFARQGLNIKANLQQLRDTDIKLQDELICQLQRRIRDYIWYKEKGFHAIQHQQARKISMHALGG